MASACHDLLCLVLQRVDRHPIGEVDGVDIERFGLAPLDTLLAHRILMQQSRLKELDGCPVQWFGDKPFLFDLEGERPPEEVDPRLLTTYEIDVLALCRALRRANQLAGPPVVELAEGAYFIGHRGSGRRRRSLCFVRVLRDEKALETIYVLRGHIATGHLIVLTPNMVELRRPTLRGLATENAVVISIPETLVNTASDEPFVLDSPVRLDADASVLASARLRLDTANQIATLDGKEVDLTPRKFDVLVALANESKGGRRVRPPRRPSDDR